ncbi:hypothetical protein [Allomuricauda sp. SCSIO 65647]|uniref:hypothetical protein n=1 Tax=Allomuricauda sp. SCSIO 65647 TaxID=2908843 RepID=UPI001F26D5C3|nr:hypothetical protein [Muricauda sp. SCSIO 65647]UJH66638.1 hypothetical protein L0P89_11770 [Muricauda sp. SCSIO 65647]
MMKRQVLHFLLVTFIGLMGVCAQSPERYSHQNITYSDIPQEKIFVHYNSTLLFVGDYLYYKVYTLDSSTGRLSTISKIAYVELIGEDKKSIFKHKIFLNNGSGQGDYFIPPEVPSGNYKLVGYTQWMKNAGYDIFFQGDVTIINPYQGNQENLLPKDGEHTGLNIGIVTSAVKGAQQEINDQNMTMVADKNSYDNRSKVSLTLRDVNKLLAQGTYSLSVRKVDTVKKSQRPTVRSTFVQNWRNATQQSLQGMAPEYLPELRGEIVSGKIVTQNPQNPTANVSVAISIPEKGGHQLKVVNTKADGSFRTNLEKEHNGTEMVVQVLGEQRKEYEIVLHDQLALDYPDITFYDFQIAPGMKAMIIDRSVHNQIENGYFTIKSDSLRPAPTTVPFYRDKMKKYVLDEYTRFSTVRETLVEVIDLVWSRRLEKNEYAFYVKPHDHDIHQDFSSLPLLIVDGILVQDQSSVIAYNAREVRSIAFLRDKYVVGPKIFQGVLEVETFDGNYAELSSGNHRITVDMFNPQPKKEYFKQTYESDNKLETDRIFDFRYQLLWEPNLEIKEDLTLVDFYTSDISGDFEICLEGFTPEGKSVSLRKIMTVN